MRVYMENNFPTRKVMPAQVFETAPHDATGVCQFVFETKTEAKAFNTDFGFRLVELENGKWAVRA